MNEVEIVPMAAGHIAELAALESACFSEPWTQRAFAEELGRDYSRFLVALVGGTVAGYAGAQLLGDCAYICNVAVLPEFRRQGIAVRLMRAQIDLARRAGMSEITLEVRSSNSPARALYERLGFVRVGSRRGFYRNPPENAEIYTLAFA